LIKTEKSEKIKKESNENPWEIIDIESKPTSSSS
jgi:hypothetical protein